MQVTCPSCGAVLSEEPSELDGTVDAVCPGCSERFTIKHGPAAIDPGTGTGTGSRTAGLGELGDITIFQPGALLASLDLDDSAPEGGFADRRLARRAGSTVTTANFVPPPLSLDVEAYFMILGAPPGEERIDLEQARTIFGRTGSDVELADPSVSKRHFQIDVMGREFFIRDLGSRHGTYLNGLPVRFTELLPGDEVRAGRTVLVFRTAEDGLARQV